MNTHELKTWPRYFGSLANGTKAFELRRNDRSFQVGDTLILKEWEPSKNDYTGRELVRTVSYVLKGIEAEKFGLQPGFCILSLLDLTNLKETP